MAAVHPPPSPGVGARRRGPKSLPKLPLSAFTPPNSGTSDRFPLPPSPSTVHPRAIVDALASRTTRGIGIWTSQNLHSSPSDKIGGVVISLASVADVSQSIRDVLQSSPNVPILSAMVPFNLEDGAPNVDPEWLTNASIPLAITTKFDEPSPLLREGIQWALSKGLVVNIDVKCDLIDSENGWDALEDLLGNCFSGIAGKSGRGVIVLSNILPPPRTLTIPVVKLLNHPSYRTYQTRLASLSLVSSTYINFLPPDWATVIPATPPPPEAVMSPISSPLTPGGPPILQDSKEKREWKRRIKMYLGPAVEAFGFQRILFGSSSSAGVFESSDWYELARESFAELGVDQDGIDAVFCENAKQIYGNHTV